MRKRAGGRMCRSVKRRNFPYKEFPRHMYVMIRLVSPPDAYEMSALQRLPSKPDTPPMHLIAGAYNFSSPTNSNGVAQSYICGCRKTRWKWYPRIVKTFWWMYPLYNASGNDNLFIKKHFSAKDFFGVHVTTVHWSNRLFREVTTHLNFFVTVLIYFVWWAKAYLLHSYVRSHEPRYTSPPSRHRVVLPQNRKRPCGLY